MSADTPIGDVVWTVVYGHKRVKSQGKLPRFEFLYLVCDAEKEGPDALLDVFGYADYLELEN
jgi:hypothetical protein